MIDYHIHPDFSQDARGSITDYIRRALELGLSEICFTTHYEPDPARREYEYIVVRGRREPVSSGWADEYLAQIDEYRQGLVGLRVLAGVEVGYELGLEGIIHDLTSAHNFDFVLGAVHCLDHIAITAGDELPRFKAEYLGLGAEHVATRYFEYLRAAAGSGLFDCLAHFDVYRKYIQPLYDETFGRTADEMLQPTLEFIGCTGTGLEVNTSALRRGSDEPYPAARIVGMAYDAGIRTFTTGSDAHRPEDLGFGLDRATALLARHGLEPARFRSRRRTG